jgi:hypothetical protein
MNMKRSRWFKPNEKPWEPGVYERDYGSLCVFCRWDGTRWHMGKTEALGASLVSAPTPVRARWRGLKRKPA